MTHTENEVARRVDPGRVAQVSLEQALLDFEVANARVLDLTRRLTELTSELLETRRQLDTARLDATDRRAELAEVQAENQLVKASLAYRGLRLVGDVRARLRR